MATGSNPLIRAICPAICPTAPEAAEINTVSPAFGRPVRKSAKYAVSPGMPR